MKCIPLRDCQLYDFDIQNIRQEGQVLALYIPRYCFDYDYNGPRHEAKVEIELKERGIRVYSVHQEAPFHKVEFEGKEIPIDSLSSVIEKGYTLEVLDLMVSQDAECVILSCGLFPHAKGGGVYDKIILKLRCENDYMVFKEKRGEAYV